MRTFTDSATRPSKQKSPLTGLIHLSFFCEVNQHEYSTCSHKIKHFSEKCEKPRNVQQTELLGAGLAPCLHHLSKHDMQQVPEYGYRNVSSTFSTEQIIVMIIFL